MSNRHQPPPRVSIPSPPPPADLTVRPSVGLTTEQECRAQAARSLSWRHPSANDPEDYHTEFWDQLDALASYIDTGERPA